MPSLRKKGVPGKRTLPPDFPLYDRHRQQQWQNWAAAAPGSFFPGAAGPMYGAPPAPPYDDDDEGSSENDEDDDNDDESTTFGRNLEF